MLGFCKALMMVVLASGASLPLNPPPAGQALMDMLLETPAASIHQMQELLSTGSPDEKRLACDFFRLTRNKASVSAVADALADSEPRVRERAIQALRFLGDANALPLLRHALTQAEASGHGGELRACLAALGELGDSGDADLMAPHLRDARPSVRVTAACAMAALGDVRGAGLLLESALTGAPAIQRVAVAGLGYLADSKTQTALESMAESSRYPWQAEARLALARRHAQTMKDTESQQAVWLALANDPDPQTAIGAVEALAADSDVNLMELLTPVVHAGGPAARTAAQMLRWRMGEKIHASEEEKKPSKFQGSTHQLLFEAAYTVLNSHLPQEAAFFQGDAYTEMHDAVLQEDLQDCSNNACSLGDLCQSANRHFYNAHTGAGLPHIPAYACDSGMQDTAVKSALDHWAKAETAFAGNKLHGYNAAYHLLGQVLHLMQDMGVPAHSHVDNHLDSMGDDFELWLEEVQGTSLLIPSEGLEPVTPETPSVEAFLKRMAEFSYALTSYDAVLVDDPDEQAKYLDHDLGRMFQLAYHDGWFVDTCWTLKDRNNKLVGDYDPNPLFDLGDDEWWPADGDFTTYSSGGHTFTVGNVYIENLRDGSTSYQPLTFAAERLTNTQFTVGDTLLGIYAREILPECVRYCAGLLHFFAQTFMNIPPALTLLAPVEPAVIGNDALTVSWMDADPDSNAVISWYFDVDNTGYDGMPFTGAFNEDDDGTSGQAVLDLSGFPQGAVFLLYGEICDEAQCTYSAYSPALTIARAEGEAEGALEGEGGPEGIQEGEFPEGEPPEGALEGEGGPEGVQEGEFPEGETEGILPEGEGGPEGVQEGEFPEGETREGESVEGEGGNEGEGHATEGEPEGAPSEGEGSVEEGEGATSEGEGESEGAAQEGENVHTLHSADQDANWKIGLSELLRVIQFYNYSGFHCQPGTEDGYAPGFGKRECTRHDSDYNPQDWRIDVSEVLRLIQFYNSGGYAWCPEKSTEDGFCPLQ